MWNPSVSLGNLSTNSDFVHLYVRLPQVINIDIILFLHVIYIKYVCNMCVYIHTQMYNHPEVDRIIYNVQRYLYQSEDLLTLQYSIYYL